jgi:hypothetical protein
MIKNNKAVEKSERELLKKQNLTYGQALRIFEELHEEAVSFGVINDKTIMDGCETNIRVAKILNSLK